LKYYAGFGQVGKKRHPESTVVGKSELKGVLEDLVADGE
jgi:hypothetical protein